MALNSGICELKQQIQHLWIAAQAEPPAQQNGDMVHAAVQIMAEFIKSRLKSCRQGYFCPPSGSWTLPGIDVLPAETSISSSCAAPNTTQRILLQPAECSCMADSGAPDGNTHYEHETCMNTRMPAANYSIDAGAQATIAPSNDVVPMDHHLASWGHQQDVDISSLPEVISDSSMHSFDVLVSDSYKSSEPLGFGSIQWAAADPLWWSDPNCIARSVTPLTIALDETRQGSGDSGYDTLATCT